VGQAAEKSGCEGQCGHVRRFDPQAFLSGRSCRDMVRLTIRRSLTEQGASRRYTASVQPVDLGAAAASPGGSEPMATADYLPVEHGEEAKCAQMFEVIRKYEASRSINFQARSAGVTGGDCARSVLECSKLSMPCCRSPVTA